MKDSFKYFGDNMEIDGDIIYYMVEMLECVLCDKNVLFKFKEKFYLVVVRSIIMYGTEWTIKRISV